MRVLLITHDYHRVLYCLDELGSNTIRICLIANHFKKIIEDFKPDVIISDGTCKNKNNEICIFSVRDELEKLNIDTPVYPLVGKRVWKSFLKLIERSKVTL